MIYCVCECRGLNLCILMHAFRSLYAVNPYTHCTLFGWKDFLLPDRNLFVVSRIKKEAKKIRKGRVPQCTIERKRESFISKHTHLKCCGSNDDDQKRCKHVFKDKLSQFTPPLFLGFDIYISSAVVLSWCSLESV